MIEGVSGTGKTSVGDELQRRGHQAIHGDRALAYKGDPATGEPMPASGEPGEVGAGHRHHIWRVDRVRELVADRSAPITFFCGGSRNFPAFIDLFDGVFVLDVDVGTLNERLDRRPADEFGHLPEQRRFVLHLHATKEDIPADAVVIDATAPLEAVVDEILRRVG